ncbi:MAG: hypothetical protein KGD63_13820 [Candidatus Lokiarchaeota archaeon]|nr:hypothetical protein [Candidatus Lokiarchaeota archaeon]
MIIDNLNIRVKRKFFRQINQEHEIEDMANVFPDDKEFIKILKRKLIKDNFLSIED